MPEAVAEAPGYQSVADWDWDRWAPAIAAYYGFVAFGDACHKVVLDALEESGRADDTLVVMTCDHGEMLGSHSMYQKGCMYDEAILLPFVIAGAGIEPGRRSQLSSQTEMAPTILELLDLPPLTEAQGRSLVPVIRDENVPGPQYTFSEFNGQIDGGFKERCCISARYKYAYYHGDPLDQPFDLEKDPGLGDGRAVEVVVRPVSSVRPWGEGIRGSAGAFADYPEMDAAMEEIQLQRKRATFRETTE